MVGPTGLEPAAWRGNQLTTTKNKKRCLHLQLSVRSFIGMSKHGVVVLVLLRPSVL